MARDAEFEQAVLAREAEAKEHIKALLACVGSMVPEPGHDDPGSIQDIQASAHEFLKDGTFVYTVRPDEPHQIAAHQARTIPDDAASSTNEGKRDPTMVRGLCPYGMDHPAHEGTCANQGRRDQTMVRGLCPYGMDHPAHEGTCANQGGDR